MIDVKDAANVMEVLARDLSGVAKNPASFRGLPDRYFGYYARGHDKNGQFGVIVTYSENAQDVDDLIETYKAWIKKNKSHAGNSMSSDHDLKRHA